jgi:hypothetical protein
MSKRRSPEPASVEGDERGAKRMRADDALLAQLDRLAAAPFALHQDDHIVRVDVEDGRGIVPAEDGMLREARSGNIAPGHGGDAPYGPAWFVEWFRREMILHQHPDYEFIELSAGELNRSVRLPPTVR